MIRKIDRPIFKKKLFFGGKCKKINLYFGNVQSVAGGSPVKLFFFVTDAPDE
jgi:hypothetical protein